MGETPETERRLYIVGGLSGIVGVLLLGVSFATAVGPPANASTAELTRFGQQHLTGILWGAWLQAVGPVLIIFFAFSLVHLAAATQRLVGWMTFFGGTVLMTVSLIEITFYIGALFPDPPVMPFVSLRLISAVQHLYFFVAAPVLFVPLGLILINSRVLPHLFGYLALALAGTFTALGIAFIRTLTLPAAVTGFGAVQAVWWLAASISLIARCPR